jgi:membrane protease YdiL (CAAX protease family)
LAAGSKEPTRLELLADRVFIVAATLFLLFCIWSAAVKTHGFSTADHEGETEQCELFLQLFDGFDLMGKSFVGFQPIQTVQDANSRKVIDAAQECLEYAAKSNPDDPSIFAKLIIVRQKQNLKSRTYYEHLTKLRTEEANRFAAGLSAAYGFPALRPTHAGEAEPTQSQSERQPVQPLPEEEKKRKTTSQGKAADLLAKKALVESELPKGWFGEHAMLAWQQRTGQTKQAQLTQKLIEEKAQSFLTVFVLIVIFCLISLFVGILIVFVQLLLIGRRITPPEQMPLLIAPANYNWLQIYKVFLFWLLTQIAVGTISKQLIPAHDGSVFSVALLVAVVSTVSNLAGLFFIYWFALRPHQVKFLDGIKLRFRVGKLGPVGLIFSGIATWFACLPIVLIACIIAAKYLGSHGSNNPVVGKLRDAAHTQDPVAIALFYVTIGLIAPICEESMFRGFLYPSLRRVMNVPLSMFSSAALFSLAHLDLGAMLPLFALGCVFAFAVERTKSIVPSIIAHGMWNSGTFTLVLLLFSG